MPPKANNDQGSNLQHPDLDRARRIARQRLLSLRRSGLQVLPKPNGIHDFSALCKHGGEHGEYELATGRVESAESKQPARPEIATTLDKSPSDKPSIGSYESKPLDIQERAEQLAIIQSEVSSCQKCPELAACRQNTVFGVGNPQPQLCFLGEGPGADEDRTGEPFVGAAGKLLDKIIEACKMSRDEVYILNTVKCRPPGNRNPNELELENCWPYVVRQLEVLQPQFICCLGSVAARTILQTKQSIGRMRGQFFNYRDSQVVVTYHPAYLLRKPAAKRQVWDDMKMLLAAMGRTV